MSSINSKYSERENPISTMDIRKNQFEKKFTENFILIWLDKNINTVSEEYHKSIHRLQSCVNTIKLFSNADELRKFIQHINDEKLFIIVSGSFGEQVVPEIDIQPQIYSIYVYCNQKEYHEKWAKNFQKVKGVYTDLRSIYDTFRRDIRQANNDLIPITILPSVHSHDYEQLFMCPLLLREILMNSESNEQIKREFTKFCRFYYDTNPNELNIIDHFEKTSYNQMSPIEWYTRECFISSMINRALRLYDIEILNKIAFFIRDLHRQIQDLHMKSTDLQKLTVYHGQGISNDLFKKLNMNTNDLISFNSFLLTTVDKNLSFNFAKQSANDPNLIPILFQIEIDRSKSSFPFIPLDELDYYHDTDRYILFSFNSTFRIINIQRIEDKLWQINLTLIDYNENKLKSLTDLVKKDVDKGFFSLGKMLTKTNDLNKAKNIFETLLKYTFTSDQKQLADIHRYLGIISEKMSDLSSALSHYKDCLTAQFHYLPSNHPSLSLIYGHIGMVQKQQGDLDQAFESLHRALVIDVYVPKPNASAVSNLINTIGFIFKEQKKYTMALNCFEHALKVQQKFPSSDVSPLIDTFNNIATLYITLEDYTKALQYLHEALNIQQKSDSSQPSLTAEIHSNLSIAFYNSGQYKDANEHALEAVNIAKRIFGDNYELVKKYQDQHSIIIQRK